MPFRQHFFLSVVALFIFSAGTLLCQQKISNLPKGSNGQLDSNLTMSYTDAFIYGIVEGVTEFLPISSTGHLVVVSEFLSSVEGDNQEALNAYLIVIQAGAIMAVGLLYRKEVWSMFLGLLGLDPRGKRLAMHVILAFIPAAILGPLLDDKIEEFLFGLLPIAVALFLGAIFMHWAEKRKRSKDAGIIVEQGRTLDDLTITQSLLIGFMQCVAMCPGTSRSMMTIVGGYLVGLQRKKAAEFSFLLGLLTLSAAAGYKTLTKWEVMEANLSIGPIFFGCLIAGISAALSVFWLVGYLSRRGLGIFVWYRIVLSIVLFTIYINSH
ncbi:MAG: undecaprenyl-diphosphate phosphatase [Opitutae bacterium]|nr:undecaprenyl-diphosphate phosphatase [Opitutae bacterium]